MDPTKLELVKFQSEDNQWLQSHHKGMLLYDRGLGKTVVPTMRNIDQGVGTHLVIGPANAVPTWIRHAREWWRKYRPRYDVDIFILDGKPNERRNVWNELLHQERTFQHRLFYVVYNTLQRDAKNTLTLKHYRNVDQIDLDEAHKMRSRKSQNFATIQLILRNHPNFTFETGTPITRGPEDYWTLLNCINPRYFSSYWKFVYSFCEVVDGMWGKEIIGMKPSAEENFFHILNTFARIRLKTDPEIAAQLPPKLPRRSLFVELDKDQFKYYNELDMNKVAIGPEGNLILAQTSMEKIMRFRQLLVCPRMLDPSLSLGSAFNDFIDSLDDADESDRHTVVFTPFAKALPHFRKALEQRKYQVFELKGGISYNEQQHQIDMWRKTRGIMLNTIAYAESYSLEPAAGSTFIGYEWDPNMNLQAEDRLERLTTRYPVQHTYYRYKNTVDDDLCAVVTNKHRAVTYIQSKGRLMS